jgi:hypothetical protein
MKLKIYRISFGPTERPDSIVTIESEVLKEVDFLVKANHERIKIEFLRMLDVTP